MSAAIYLNSVPSGVLPGDAERRGLSAGPVGQWTYLHRRILRIGAVTLVALILVFWGQPTVLAVILLVVILLVLLGFIELVGRPPAAPEVAEPA